MKVNASEPLILLKKEVFFERVASVKIKDTLVQS